MDNLLYITIDGDAIGQQVGRTVLNDDEEGLKEISTRINGAQDFMAHTITSLGGEVIELGGDELTGKIPAEAVQSIEAMRKDVFNSFGFTVTVGIGQSLSQAAKSLLAGKSTGKDKIVMYGPEVDAALESMAQRIDSNEGSEQDKKLSDHYLAPKEEGNDMKESEDAHCEYCDEMDPHTHEQEGEQDHEHSGDDCEYCQEADGSNPDEVGQDEAGDEHSHEDGESCEYCDDADGQQAGEGDPEASQDDADDDSTDGESQDDQDPVEEEAVAGDQAAQDEHTEEGMKQIAEAIENEETSPSELSNMDDADMAVGSNMDDGTSRPDDYDDADDHTLGLSEDDADDDQGPDLGSVLKDGLDDHADNIQKEKVSQMVGQALEGFKANKKVLEMAQQQAPEFYQASISMLKAMIEMAKMLGLSDGSDAQPGDDDGSETEGQEVESEEQEDPTQSAPPQQQSEGQAPPKPKGQSAKA